MIDAREIFDKRARKAARQRSRGHATNAAGELVSYTSFSLSQIEVSLKKVAADIKELQEFYDTVDKVFFWVSCIYAYMERPIDARRKRMLKEHAASLEAVLDELIAAA
jgi:hypothetical protein